MVRHSFTCSRTSARESLLATTLSPEMLQTGRMPSFAIVCVLAVMRGHREVTRCRHSVETYGQEHMIS